MSPPHTPLPSADASVDLATALTHLRDRLATTSLRLDLADTDEVTQLRDSVVDQIDDYLLPRVSRLDAPLLVVIGGSTGAGKSTLTNTLVGAEVSTPGVLRPTTRSPVLICHPDERTWFDGSRILGGLSRVTGADPGTPTALRLETSPAVPIGLALLDTPDIDSVEAANRALAAQLLAAADLWLFVTTAARYADAVPWDFLRQASDRSTALAVVLNRVPAPALDDVTSHLRTMLDDAGLDRAQVFSIAEGELDDGRIPGPAVAPMQSWLDGLVADADNRAALIRQTLDGALDGLEPSITTIADELDAQRAAVAELDNAIDLAYGEARRGVNEGLDSGVMLRSEVLERWQEVIGSGDFMRSIQGGISRLRDAVKGFVTGKESVDNEAKGALESNLEALLHAEADQAALRVVQLWRTAPGGQDVIGDDRAELERATADFAEGMKREIRDWQGEVIDLVKAQGEDKRLIARTLSLGINSVGVALMIVVFAQTGGLTGAEVAIAGGSATVSQTLLTALFGDQAVRSLAAEARRKLQTRVDGALDREATRFRERLMIEATGDGADAEAAASEPGADLTAALAAVRGARS